MRERILRMMMKNPDAYYSGEQMAQSMNVTRAAIWKHIDALKRMGCEFDSKPNRGYRLLHLPDGLNQEILSTYDFAGVTKRLAFHTVASTQSTNELAKQLAQRGAMDKTVVIAEEQTGGKGRMGRSWVSEPGRALTFSLILRPRLSPIHAGKVGLIAAVSVAEAIRSQTGVNAMLKWPNDVLVAKKKICGILTEMSAEYDTIEHVICGIGVNVNTTNFPAELMPIATSLKMETGRTYVRGQLLLGILGNFADRYDAWVKTEDFSPIVAEYTRLSMLVGKAVSVESHGAKTQGTCVGFDKDGFMIVEVDGKRRRTMAGDVSVRSDDTYV
jgi:BirA family biotin operon repressor/biotin-[acetyl-CoA-carboxylase] ligase